VNPLFLRNIYLIDYEATPNERLSGLDLFNKDEKARLFPDFDYSLVSHVDLAPGDCLYIPSNWWLQIHNRMNEKIPNNDSQQIDQTDIADETEVNVKWIEYSFASVSLLADEAIYGLEHGYGS